MNCRQSVASSFVRSLSRCPAIFTDAVRRYVSACRTHARAPRCCKSKNPRFRSVHASGRSGGAEEESSSLMTGHGESVCLSRRESRRFLKNRVLLFYYTYLLLPERTFLMEDIFMNCQYNSFCRDSDTAALSATDVSRALGERSTHRSISFHFTSRRRSHVRHACRAGLQARYRKAPAPMPRQIKPRNGKLRVLNHRARDRRRKLRGNVFIFYF